MVIEDNTLLIFKPWLLGYCNCGCGEQVGYKKKKQNKFRHGHNIPSGKDHHNYKDGSWKERSYRTIYKSNHPFRDKYGRVKFHRYVLEQYLSQKYNMEIYILPYFDVHHIDRNTKNNDVSNLIYLTKQEHLITHFKKDFSDRKCSICERNKTYVKKGTGPQWYSDNEGGWLCQKCHRLLKRHQKGRLVLSIKSLFWI